MPIIDNIVSVLQSFWPFIVAISVLVFIHEYGHFWVGRKNGVQVDVFSIGFGKELFGFTDKLGTRWRVSLIPLGGYVKFAGDADVSSTTVDEEGLQKMTDEQRSQTLTAKTPLQRIAVSIAGPAANYIFAICALIVMLLIKGTPQTQLMVAEVKEEMNAQKAGLLKGDIIKSINQQEIKRQQDALKIFKENEGKVVDITVERMPASTTPDENNAQQATTHTFSVPLYEEKDGVKQNSKMGIALYDHATSYNSVSILEAITKSLSFCWTVSVDLAVGIKNMIIRGSGELGGIGSIGAMANQSVEHGLWSFIMFLVVLSINLGFVNLLPIPVLDGGSILMSTIELIRGKALSAKLQERIYMGGFAIVASLMLYTTYADIMRFKVFEKIMSLFSGS